MKKKIFFHFGLVVFIVAAFFSCNGNNQNTEISKTISNDSLVKRGEYLVAILGCNDCHSAKTMGPNGTETDISKQLSGYPSATPIPSIDTNTIKKGFGISSDDFTLTAGTWGISFSANITSDKATGIGNWTEDQFARAMTQGKYNGDVNGRMILPPMPWQDFSNLHDEDVRAIFAYLKNTKPVVNKVPAPIAFNQIK